MLYLIFELERSVRMSSAKLSPALASSMQRRLQDLAEVLRGLGTHRGS